MTMYGFQTGPIGSGIAAAELAANLLVTRNSTEGQIALCGAGGIPIGVTTELVASGERGEYRRPVKGAPTLVKGTTAIAVSEFVKSGANGEVAPEANVAVRTADTIGIASSACSGAHGLFEIEWL